MDDNYPKWMYRESGEAAVVETEDEFRRLASEGWRESPADFGKTVAEVLIKPWLYRAIEWVWALILSLWSRIAARFEKPQPAPERAEAAPRARRHGYGSIHRAPWPREPENEQKGNDNQ